MKALVFGRTGQVAQEIARRMPDALFLGRSEADFADPRSVTDQVTAIRPDIIINAAAYTAVDRAEAEPDLAHAINAHTVAEVAATAARLGIPFLHISTDYVFDGSCSAARKETDDTGPLGVYGATKLAGEQAVAAAGGCWAVLRTSWVFSAHGTNFVKTMLRLGAEREELGIVSDQIGGPTPAADIAQALTAMAGHMCQSASTQGLYHFSGAPDVSWAGFAREIFRQAGVTCKVRDILTTDYPTPARRPQNSRLDCTKLTRDFGIERPDWRKGLSAVLAEMRS